MQWFIDHPIETWLLIAAMLAIAELLSADMILIMLAGGALGGVVAAALGTSFPVQLGASLVLAVLLLSLLRPPIIRKLHGGPTLESGAPAVVGQLALVLEPVGATTPGRVKIGGDVWSAQISEDDPAHAQGGSLEPGTTVEVTGIRGGMALVRPSGAAGPGTDPSHDDRGVR